MKEHPLLFSAPMVRALLDGTKTQTRRVVKFPPIDGDNQHAEPHRAWLDRSYEKPSLGGCACLKMPYGPEEGDISTVQRIFPNWEAGERIYVRESYYQFGHWEPIEGKRTKGGRQKWMFVPDHSEIVFHEPGHAHVRKGRHHRDPSTPAWHKRLGRFMPRAASRITLDITHVRVERLQDISEEDCWAEGIEQCDGQFDSAAQCLMAKRLGCSPEDARPQYALLWESINGPGSWDANPFVWVIEFTRIPQP